MAFWLIYYHITSQVDIQSYYIYIYVYHNIAVDQWGNCVDW
jgi:hypothetical protein